MPSLPSRISTLEVAVKKHAKVDIKTLFSFTGFLNFVPNILPRIVDKLIKKTKLRLDKFPKI